MKPEKIEREYSLFAVCRLQGIYEISNRYVDGFLPHHSALGHLYYVVLF
jgi:hypothetical protein